MCWRRNDPTNSLDDSMALLDYVTFLVFRIEHKDVYEKCSQSYDRKGYEESYQPSNPDSNPFREEDYHIRIDG